MSKFDHRKYRPYPVLPLKSRKWPDNTITQAPKWCSVDLRDGNQALIEPMTPSQKMRLYNLLLAVGFKEIEVGFPAASQHDYDFVRKIIEEDLIPEDVTIQVLVQTREELITKTFEALAGVKKAIVHVYNSTSPVQRENVFGLDKEGIKQIAIDGAQAVKRLASDYPETQWTFEYSPESFTGTEIDYAIDVCNAVIDVWQPTAENKVIINLPATVEMSTPNVYADQIEYFCNKVDHRESLLISLHTHNDRGCGVAASELGLLAGADRVEGTLMGNGERTGNLDIMVMGMNMYSQGVDPELDFSNMDEIIECVNSTTQLPVHPRHPYAGDLVFTAFSGSHQDAIKKCLDKYQEGEPWTAAYLPIDPADLGRSYEEVIRINSQSGKGGVAYVLDREYDVQLPRWMQIEFSAIVQKAAESTEAEISPEAIWELFAQNYLSATSPYQLDGYHLKRDNNEESLMVNIKHNDVVNEVHGRGAGVVEAFMDAIRQLVDKPILLIEYSEHAMSQSSQAQAIAYIQLNIDGQRVGGSAMSSDIVDASLKAILSAINRAY